MAGGQAIDYPTNGIINITLTSEDTIKLPCQKYDYGIMRSIPDTPTNIITLKIGEVNILPSLINV